MLTRVRRIMFKYVVEVVCSAFSTLRTPYAKLYYTKLSNFLQHLQFSLAAIDICHEMDHLLVQQ